jgi:catechol 2,3-dioxygenase-like lactoylglutathione lyase family enzyme
MKVTGIVWMGIRTTAHPEMHRLFGSVMNMGITHQSDGVTWFELPGGEEIQIYSDADRDHTFFPSGPVIGFQVEDFGAALAELTAAGIELIGDGDGDQAQRWQHFRGPDGNVYEIMGPELVTP